MTLKNKNHDKNKKTHLQAITPNQKNNYQKYLKNQKEILNDPLKQKTIFFVRKILENISTSSNLSNKKSIE